MAGIRDWSAKKVILRSLYDVISDTSLVLRVVEGVDSRIRIAKESKFDFVDKCAGTLGKWKQSTPTGTRSQLFWKWVIQDFELNVRMSRLWSCLIEDFIGFFPPAEAEIDVAVRQMLNDERVHLDPNSRETIEKRFTDGSGTPPGRLPGYNIHSNDALRIEGPITGMKNGRIHSSQFYNFPEAAAAWTDLIDTKGYRMYLDCLLSLKKMLSSEAWMDATQDGRHHVAVMLGGGGSPEKDWVVATSLLESVKELAFVIADISPYMIRESSSILGRRLRKNQLEQRVHVDYEWCDFMRLDESSRCDNWQSVVWAILGGTIGNVLEGDFFRSLRGPSRVGDLFLVGLDTLDDASDEQFEERMNTQYPSKETEALLLAPFREFADDEPNQDAPIVKITVVGNRKLYSDISNSRTAVFSTDKLGESDTIVATSTRYDLEEFIAYAGGWFGWKHLGTETASDDSTFRQLLFRRVK